MTVDFQTLLSSLQPQQQGTPDFQSMFAEFERELANQPPPEMESVPGGVHPLGAFGSTFAATLADALGARGQAGANEQRLQGAQEAQAGARQRNAQAANDAFRQRQQNRLGLMLKIGEAKLQMFMDQQDSEQAAKQAQINFRNEVLLKKQAQEGEAEKQAAMLGRALAVEDKRQGGRKELVELKEGLATARYGNDPAMKAKIEAAKSKATKLQREFDAKYRLAGTALGSYQQDASFSQADLDAASAKLDADLNAVWDDVLSTAATTGATPVPNEDDFYTP